MPPRHRHMHKIRIFKLPKESKSKKNPVLEATIKRSYGSSVVEDTAVFYLPPFVAFKAIFCVRIISAIWLHVSDFDETYNYWEPSHHLLFNYGYRTWEYSPKYALRSYLYLLIHATPAWIYNKLFKPNRLLLFYFIRCFLAVICTCSEVFFYKGVCREFGINVGRLTLIILIFSPGMFVAGTAFLPSSFCMYITLLSMAAWFHRKHALALFLTILSTFISWPFSAIIGIPVAYEMTVMKQKWRKFRNWLLLSTFTALVPLIDIDLSYYKKITFVPWNVLKYSFFGADNPDSTYQPWHFYIFNGFLNFNISFLLVFVTPWLLIWIQIILPKKPRNEDCYPYKLSLGMLFLWMLIFLLRPSKREYFLFPIYPLIALNAAIGIDAVQVLWFRYIVKKGHHYTTSTVKISLIITICYCIMGASRMMALYKASHAPMDVFIELTNVDANITDKNTVNLCSEKEWKRYPSSYFLPDRWRMNFIRTIDDKLPDLYVPNDGSNGEKKSNAEKTLQKYVNIDLCDYLVDVDNSISDKSRYSTHRNWTIVYTTQFLDRESSSWFWQSFYIPMLWESSCNFLSYHLLKRNQFSLNKSAEDYDYHRENEFI